MPPTEPQAPPTPPVEWRLRFWGAATSLDTRINTRGLLATIRADEFVSQVRRLDHENYSVVFHEGRTSPFSEEVSRLCRTYQYVEPPPPPRHVQRSIQEIRDSLVSEYISTSNGRSRLAASMVAPIRQRMDYQAIGRRTFQIEGLPAGALPIYDRDPGVAVITFPTFEIASNPTIQLSDIQERRFSLIDRMQPMSMGVTMSPFETPAWCVANAWAYDAEKDHYIKILRIEGDLAHLFHWRMTPSTSVLHVRALAARFKPCEPPKEPTSRFARVLTEDGPKFSQESLIQAWVSEGGRRMLDI